MPKVKCTLWLSKREPDGKCPVYLVLRHKQERAVVSLPVRLPAKHWNDRTGDARKTWPTANQINRFLHDRRSEAENALQVTVLDGEPRPCKRAKEMITIGGASVQRFFPYAEQLVADWRGQGKISTARHARSILNRFRSFAGETLTFSEINGPLLRRYAAHLASKYGNKGTTIQKTLGTLRIIWNTAKRDELVDGNPFRGVRVKTESTIKQRLSLDQIRKIEEAECTGLLSEIRDWFLFAFFAGGLRFSDVALLRWDQVIQGQDWRLRFTQKKTGGTAGALLVPQAQSILERNAGRGLANYCFPIMRTTSSDPEVRYLEIGNRNALVNKYLRRLSVELELPRFSFHVARHSLADHMRKSGASLYDISKTLGHATTGQTEDYLASFDQDALDETMRGLF